MANPSDATPNPAERAAPWFARYRWPVHAAGLVLLLMSSLAWALIEQEQARIRRTVEAGADSMAAALIENIQVRVPTIMRYARRLERITGVAESEWEEDAVQLMRHNPGYAAIARVDRDFRVRSVVPRRGNEELLRQNLADGEEARRYMEELRDRREVSVSPPRRTPAGIQILTVFVPLYAGPDFDGFIMGVLQLNRWLDTVWATELGHHYHIAVLQGGREIYRHGPAGTRSERKWGREATPTFYGVTWTLRVWPSSQLIGAERSALPWVCVVAGVLLAALTGFTVSFAQSARERAREAQRANDLLQEAMAARLRSEAELKEYSLALANALPGRAQLDADGRLVHASEGLAAMLGFAAEELTQHTWETLIHVEDRRLVHEALARVQGEGVTDLEARAITRNGATLFLHILIVPALADSGHSGHLLFLRDITGHKETERILRLSEIRHAAILEAALDAVITMDQDGLIVEFNRAAEQIFGLGRERAIGQRLADLIIPESLREKHRRGLEHYLSTGVGPVLGQRLEMTALRADGSEFPVEMSITVVGQANEHLFTAHLRDITERRRAEERFRLAVEGAPNAMVMVDGQARILMVNSQAEHLFGYARSELVGQSLDLLVPNRFRGSHDRFVSTYFEQPRARPMGAATELYGRRKDGSEFPAEIALNPIRTADGMVALSAILDVTQRKAAEQKLQKLAEDLRRSNQELEQFAYVASHDLQEPLRMVTSYLQLLNQRYRERLDDSAREFIDYAVTGALRMKTMINDLLVYSRVGTRGAPFTPVDLERTFHDVLQNLEVAVAESQAAITHDPLPTVSGDPMLLLRLLQNLLGNAIKFRRSEPPRVHVQADLRSGHWLFAVKDNGIGIDPQYFTRIFQVFQRLHTREQYAGSGIGLAVCKRIVERHGGTIWVESEPGQGSTFYFTLPGPA